MKIIIFSKISDFLRYCVNHILFEKTFGSKDDVVFEQYNHILMQNTRIFTLFFNYHN